MIIYSFIGDLGISIIIFTIIVKSILFPLTKKQHKAQKDIKNVQPKLQKLKEKYKDDQKKLLEKQTELYKSEKINPVAGCLPILVQLPIFIAIYWLLKPDNVLMVTNGHFEVKEDVLYSLPFIKDPGQIKASFLGLVNLMEKNIFLAALTSISQFIYSRMLTQKRKKEEKKDKEKAVEKKEEKKEPNIQDALNQQMKMMNYFFPIMFFFVSMSVPAGLPLYWTTSSVVSIVQHKILEKNK